MKEYTAVSEVNNDAIDKLQQKLRETELTLQEETELREKTSVIILGFFFWYLMVVIDFGF